MSTLFVIAALIPSAFFLGAGIWRWRDHNADAIERSRLQALQPNDLARFDPATVKDLPDAAQRYFLFTISPGALLHTVAEISMTGQFSLGTKKAPNYLEMTAQQTLAAPHGFIWKMRASSSALRISGSDSARWTRFWLFGLLPVARMGGDSDHARSAFGRYVAEAVFWTPAALLPGPGIEWRPLGQNSVSVTIKRNGLRQDVELVVDDLGRPIVVRFLRWSNANRDKVYRLQPFGGHLSEFRSFSGFTLPTHVEAGNNFGTEDYFPFFLADISHVDFPRPVQTSHIAGAGAGSD